jgi:prephenate dehydrogenase
MNQPLVVGYKGEIGSFILGGLLRIMPKALDIWCVDINETDEEVTNRIKKADVIFLCVPLQETMNWLLKHKVLLKKKIIIEQCSLKEWLCESESVKDLDIRSMHILFRPSQTPNLDDRKVALFENQYNDVPTIIAPVDIKKITQAEIVWYKDAKEHDKKMAIQQALLHRTLLILGKLLKECEGSTFISKKVLELEERIKKGNLELYKIIQSNKYLPAWLDRITKEFEYFDIEKYWARSSDE